MATPVPALSVVVPTHGRVELFAKTLISIQKQTIDQFELIVTDDSTVESERSQIRKLTSSYADQTERHTKYLFTEPRLGQAKNTNQGLFAASANVIRILHSDDLLRPEAIAWELEAFQRIPNIALMFQDCIPFQEDSALQWPGDPVTRYIEPLDYFRQFLSTSTGLPSGMLFTRQALDEVQGMRSDWSFLCDWDFFAKLLLWSGRRRQMVAYATPGNYAWRLHPDSTTTKNWQRHFLEHDQLMKDWTTSLPREEVFTCEKEAEQFFQRGDEYRYQRLFQDLQPLRGKALLDAYKWSFRHAAFPHFRRFKKHIRRSLKQRFLGKQSTMFVPTSPPSTQGQSESWVPELTISPHHSILDSTSDCLYFVIPYDNSISAWPFRSQIRQATKLRITSINSNRYFKRTLYEILKYVSPGCEVEFAFRDNELVTWFGLKSMLSEIAPGRMEFLRQTHSPLAGTQAGHSDWKIAYRCTQEAPSWFTQPLTGITVGLLTLGDRKDDLLALWQSLLDHCDYQYEFLVVSPSEIDYLPKSPKVRSLIFKESDTYGWITRKKNWICREAQFNDVVLLHDRFAFTQSFFDAFENWGSSYGIATPKVRLPDGSRALDWGVVCGPNYSWCEGGLLEYRDASRYGYVPGGVTMIRKPFWEKFPWSEDLFWNEHEDVELCRRLQRAGEQIHLFPGELITSRDRWVEQNPLIPYNDWVDLP